MTQKYPVPNALWLAIISLAVFGLFHFIVGLSNPIQFFAAAINAILIYGLMRLAKWAYFLSIIASLLSPFVLSLEGTMYFIIILLVNCTVLIPVLVCTKVFFYKNTKEHVTA